MEEHHRCESLGQADRFVAVHARASWGAAVLRAYGASIAWGKLLPGAAEVKTPILPAKDAGRMGHPRENKNKRALPDAADFFCGLDHGLAGFAREGLGEFGHVHDYAVDAVLGRGVRIDLGAHA